MNFWNKRHLVLLQAGSVALTATVPAVAADTNSLNSTATPPQTDSTVVAQTDTQTQSTNTKAEATPENSETIAEVVVTAQKREQKLQDVPEAVTAFSQGQLESRNIQDVIDLNSLAPGLQVSKTAASATIAQISIRGIGEINPAIFWDPGVGLYLDDVYLGNSQGGVFDAVDLERIEVLRGPQGTLYGRNTMGGAIKLVTKKPTGEFGMEENLEVGNFGALTNKISVDLPKFGITSISFGVRTEHRDGWVTTTIGSSTDELNNAQNAEWRIGANFAFSPTFQADYRFDHSDIDQKPPFAQLYRADSTFPAFSPGAPFGALPSYASQDRQTTASVDAPEFEHSKVFGHSMTFTWDINEHNTFKSITAYRHLYWDDAPDIDGSPLPVAYGQRYTHYHQWSQELQLVGHIDQVNYVGGLYYYTSDAYTNNPQSYFANAIIYDSQYGAKSGAGAAYTQVDYKPIDPLTLTAGVRYTQEYKALDRIFGFTTSPTIPYTYVIPAGTHADAMFRATTPTFSVAYKVNEDMNVYTRYAQGFKSGGFNGEYSNLGQSPAQNIAETQTPFRPEKQKSIEIGAKTTEWGGRAQLNAAVFHNKNKDMQESIFTASGAAATLIRNAGQSTVRGVELEGVVVPIDGTKVQANYAWLHTRYDEFIDTDTGNNVASNRAFPHAPKNTFNVVIDSRLAKFDWGTVRALADYEYTSSFYTYPYQLADTDPRQQVADDSKVKGYGTLNLRLALTQVPLGSSASGELALWARNVTDEKVAANFIDFGPSFGNLTSAYFIDPRTYGINGIIRF